MRQKEFSLPDNIAIVGVGMIGGSIAMGIKRILGTGVTILGATSSLSNSQKAKENGIIDEILDGKNINKAGLIIIATPISVIPDVLSGLKTKLKKSTLIIDVASVKKSVLSEAQKLPPYIHFIGTHPMAGNEAGGWENGEPYLFINKPWILTLGNKNTPEELKLVTHMVKLLGAEVFLIDADTHDKLVSEISHLPLIAGSVIINSVAKNPNWKLLQKTASTGFRDSTRLASHSPELKRDIILNNKTYILEALIKFKKETELLINIIESNEKEELFDYFARSKNIRDDWIAKYFG